MRIGGIFKPNALLGSYVVGDRFFLSHYDNPLPVAVLLQTHDSSAGTTGTPSTPGWPPIPNLKIQTRAQFEKSQQAQVNQLLGLVYALLALAVVIALIGIVNTLMLSVFERTHEIGLLRAVGMKRRQVRAMIRSESVILAVFGAIIGIVVGTALGIAFAASLKQQGITDIVIPFGSLVVFLFLVRPARPGRRQLAGAAGGQARRPGRHRVGVTTVGPASRRHPRVADRHVLRSNGRKSKVCLPSVGSDWGATFCPPGVRPGVEVSELGRENRTGQDFVPTYRQPLP